MPPITQNKQAIIYSDEAEDIEERPVDRSNTIKVTAMKSIETPTKTLEPNDPANPKRFISQQHYSKDPLSVSNGPLENRILMFENEERALAKSEVHSEKFFNIEGDNGSPVGQIVPEFEKKL